MWITLGKKKYLLTLENSCYNSAMTSMDDQLEKLAEKHLAARKAQDEELAGGPHPDPRSISPYLENVIILDAYRGVGRRRSNPTRPREQ